MQEILNSKKYAPEKTGIPILVFHGLFGMLDNWGGFAKVMSEHLPVHLVDLRNHGRSFHSEEMSHETMAQDIKNYLEHYNIKKAHLLGHSLGGKAVMQCAIQFPNMIEKLIVVDMAPKAYPPHHQGIFKALNSVNFEKTMSRQEVENKLHQYISDISIIQFLTKNLYWKDLASERILDWRFNLKILHEKYDTFVSKNIKFGVFSGETLFIAGENSNYILVQDEFLIKQQFPNYHLVKIKNSGHWVQADNPVDFNEAVKNFLIGS